ncbi:hypothetical protein NDU88_005600 [Pleurodeles waltl]|uniref:Uncharacterized protein n=1 Tax=Pleurodeles waltl TaxID=8319 RepID=A0AAV7TBT0_PLEWA|nr:hypothetical protein NDU88_005600 [Pleurodeles waltl]
MLLGVSKATRLEGAVSGPRPGENHGLPQPGRPPTHRFSQRVADEPPRLRGLPIPQGSLGSCRGRSVPSVQVDGEITWLRSPFCFERPQVEKN